ncbi:MAG: alpha/beta hydrolase [Gammaproteobacteria bacterium]
MTHSPILQEEQVRFPSGGLTLEGRFAYDETLLSPLAKVLVCPPHPFLGGDMNNNVVARLGETLALGAFAVFRFNYRGIGASESDRDLQKEQQLFWERSTCPDYETAIHEDCRSALAWLKQTPDPGIPVYVAGYSFGCLPALELSESDGLIRKLALISPPLTKWRISAGRLNRVLPRSLFFATGDFACPESDVESLYRDMPEPKSMTRFRDAEHFFIGREVQLAAAVLRFMEQADD